MSITLLCCNRSETSPFSPQLSVLHICVSCIFLQMHSNLQIVFTTIVGVPDCNYDMNSYIQFVILHKDCQLLNEDLTSARLNRSSTCLIIVTYIQIVCKLTLFIQHIKITPPGSHRSMEISKVVSFKLPFLY